MKVTAPEGVKVKELPLQIEPPETLMVGRGLTATDLVINVEHPAALVPFKVYTALETGFTVTAGIIAPVFQE